MMEKEANNKEWSLVRNDNGEWVSNECAVFLSRKGAAFLKATARQQGKTIHIQHWVEGQYWCYRHELEALGLTVSNRQT